MHGDFFREVFRCFAVAAIGQRLGEEAGEGLFKSGRLM